MNLKSLLTSLSLGFASLIALLVIMNLGYSLPVAQAAGSTAPPASEACLQPAAICASPNDAGPASAAVIPLRATFVVTIPASKDNTMYSEDGNLSLGAGENIFAGKTNGGNIRRALIAFDLTGNVPAGATIENATLRLYLTLSPAGVNSNENVQLHRLSANWGEGTSVEVGNSKGGDGAPVTNGDASWTHRFYTSTLWTTPGGNFIMTPSATTAVGTVNLNAPPILYTWSSPQVAADVQLWVNNPGQNFGWLLKTNEVNNKTARRFASKQFVTPANRPVLVVTYSVPSPVLAISKTVSDRSPGANENVTYTIVVSNTGNAPATNVRIFDQEPAGINFNTASIIVTPPGGITNTTSTQIAISGLTIAPGQRVTTTFNATVANNQGAGTLITNTATVTSAEIATPVGASVRLTVTNLAISKTASKPDPAPGEVVTFTVVATNVANRTFSGVRISDPLPAGVALGQIVNQPGVTEGFINNTVMATRSLDANETMTLTFSVVISENLSAGDVITNTASVTGSINLNLTSASTVLVLSPPPPPNLTLSKRVNVMTAAPGQPVIYTIVVTNSGGIATGARISDTLPAGITFVGPITFSPPNAGTPGNSGTLPTLASDLKIPGNTTLVLTLPVMVSPGLTVNTVITNTAAITSSEVATPSTGSVVLTVPFPELTLDKRVSNPDPQAGEDIIYTITVTNTGAATATDGIIFDNLPSGIIFNGPVALDPPDAGTINPLYPLIVPSPAANLTIPPGAAITLTLPVRVSNGLNVGDVVTNSASIQVDEVSTVAADSVTIEVSPVPPLDITKQVSNLLPHPGEIITFTIRITNNSIYFLPNIEIFDNLDPDLNFGGTVVVDPPNPGFTGPAPFLATSLDLASGESLTLTFQVQVDPGVTEGTVLTNTARATNYLSFAPFSPFFTKISNPVSLTIPTIGLTVTKLLDNPNPEVGGFASYTIVVTNTGDIDAIDVTISDTLPASLTLAGPILLDPQGSGTIGSPPTLATIPNLPPGSNVKVTIPVQVNPNVIPGSIITNTAAATSTDVIIPVTDAISLTVIPQPVIGLDVLKQVSKSDPQAGEIITYTIVVANIGQATATNIRVADFLPGSVTFLGPVSLTPPGALLNPTLPTLASGLSLTSGTSLTLTFPVRVNFGVVAGTILTNTASVTSAEVITPAAGTVVVTVAPSPVPVLALTKQVNNATPQAGSIVTYTVSVTNTGSVNATGMRISDTLPAGLTFVGPISLNPPGAGTPGNGGSLPTLASNVTLNAGQRLTLTFPVLVNTNLASGALITNSASVTSTQVATPSTGQVTLRVISSTTPAAGPIFFPLILKTLPAFPDLVGSFRLTPNQTNFAAGAPVAITVVVTNVGTAVADSFWVDFYINPSVTPGVNLPWNQACSLSPCYGIAWFVPPGLGPGESVTLTSTPGSYSADHTIWPGSFASGTSELYLYVDSWNPTVPTGGILESNENNNLFKGPGLTVTGLTTSSAGLPDPAQLPPRPAP